MLDFDDIDALERYALASNAEERRQLLQVAAAHGSTAVTPGQLFLSGLNALELGDVDGASQVAQRLKAIAPRSDHCQRLEALVALRTWPTDPAATCKYLETRLRLSFNASPPAAVSDAQHPSPARDQGSETTAGATSGFSSSLDPASYSETAFLKKAVRLARARGSQQSQLAGLLSTAGRFAALSGDKDLDLNLTLQERLKLLGVEGGSWRSEALAQALAGSSLLVGLAKEAHDQFGSFFESLTTYMTLADLEGLLAEMPPAAAATPALLSCLIRKLYGTKELTPRAAAAAVDGPIAACATPHLTPLLTAAEADAVRRRVLELCGRMRQVQKVEPERLAWVEARALLPLAESAVRAAAVAAAAATADNAEAAEAVAGKVKEAVGLLAPLLRSLSALVLPGWYQFLAAGSQQPTQPPSVALGPALPPLPGDVQPAVLRMLSTVLQLAPDPPALFAAGGELAGLLGPSTQARLLAEAMLTRGSPSPPSARSGSAPVDWVAAYRDTGGDVAALAEAVELELSGPERVGEGAWAAPDDDVVLLLTHKAVQHVSVLVYDIATESYYRDKSAEVGMDVDLEGLGATFQFDLQLPADLPQLQRYRRAVRLPQLKGRRGVWVVEVQGGGRHSRALVRCGALSAVVRPSPAGLALTLFREDGSPVADPRVWVDGRAYTPSAADAATATAAAREVVVPYRASSSATVPAVLVDTEGGFASLMKLMHLTEEYELRCAMHFEPETAAAGGRGGAAPLLLQPSLTIGGWAAPLELLQDVTLTVEVDDLEADPLLGGSGTGSGARRQVFQDWSTGDGLRAAVAQVRLPDRPGRVRALLTARLRRVAKGADGEPDYQTFNEERIWTLNESDREQSQLRDLYLTRGADGTYLLRLLGRAGEPFSGVPVVVALTHAFSAATVPPVESTVSAPPNAAVDGDDALDVGQDGSLVVRQTLVTDSNGTINLGHLRGITAIAAGVEATPHSASDTASSRPSAGRPRRRYCWRLPGPLTGAVALCIGGGAEEEAVSGRDSGGVAGGLRSKMVLRALAAGGSGAEAAVQVRIPFASLSASLLAGADVGAEAAAVTGGLALVSLAAVAEAESPAGGVAEGPSPPLPSSYDPDQPDAEWQTAERLDSGHVAVRQGAIEVAGLAPGVYRLLAPRLDLSATILVYQGAVVAPAGVLKAAAAAAAAAAAGPAPSVPYGFVMASGLIAPLSEPEPLRVVELTASAEGGVTARLAGSPAQLGAAVVHLVVSRFEPNALPWRPPGNTVALGTRRLSAAPGGAFGQAEAGSYQSGRRLGDEVRYVLERRRLVAEGRVRPMPALVDRPSLLMQPWKVRETTTTRQEAQKGEAFKMQRRGRTAAYNVECDTSYFAAKPVGDRGCSLFACGDAPRASSPCRVPAPRAPQQKDVASVGLSFCPPAVVLPNLAVGADGAISVSPQQLAAAVAAAVGPTGILRLSSDDPWVAAGHRVVRLVAYTAPAGVPSTAFGALSYCEARAEVRGCPPPAFNDPRVTTALQRPFAAGSAAVERRGCHPLHPGTDLVIADAATAKLQLYGTVSKVWALYGALLGLFCPSPVVPYFCDSDEAAKLWAEFSCISSWAGLSRAAKAQRYSLQACTELAFFCYCHDPDFFRTVVQPYLQLRLPSSRGLLESWLAGLRGAALVEVWGAPHRYRKLTPLERVILAWEEDLLAQEEARARGVVEDRQGRPLPRLSRLAADMRARVRARVAGARAAAEAAEANRRRFEIALNGPGQGDDDKGQDGDLAAMDGAAFDDDFESEGAPAPAAAAPALYGAAPPRMFAAAAPPPAPAMMAMAMPMAAAAPPNRLLREVRAAPQAVGFGGAPPPPGDLFGGADLMARRAQEAEPAYRAPPATQEWAEAGWYRRTKAELADGEAISPESDFWADLAEHLARGGRLGPGEGAAFLPRNLESAGWTFSDALLATAVVGVRWEESQPLSVARGTRLTLTAAAPTIAYVRQTEAQAPPPAAAAAGGEGEGTAAPSRSGRVLLLQQLLDPNLDPSEAKALGWTGAGEEDDDDDVEHKDAAERTDGVEVPPGAPLAYGRLYCYAVTLTNTGASNVRLDVSVQAPQGAVALGGKPALWISSQDLIPYGAARLPLYYFYFPRPQASFAAAGGEGSGGDASYDAFPAAASLRGKMRSVAFGQPAQLKVLSALPPPPAPDLSAAATESWTRLAALPPTPEADAARLRFLAEGTLPPDGLTLVLWRCRDAAFWRAAVAALRRRHVWDSSLWSYAVLHRDEEALREYLAAAYEVADELVGPLAPAAGQLFISSAAATATAAATTDVASGSGAVLTADQVLELMSSADRPEHFEYWPLVNARAHPLGGKRAVLNDAVDGSWRSLLRRLAAVTAGGREPGLEDLMAAAYYLTLQDRAVEATAVLRRIEALTASAASPNPPGSPTFQLQLCYLRAWLVLADPASGQPELAAAAAAVRQWIVADANAAADADAAVAAAPVLVLEPKWQARLVAMAAALEEAAGIAAGAVGAVGGSGGADAGGAAEAPSGSVAGSGKATPMLLLYGSREGPRGSVVLDVSEIEKVALNVHFMDLELLFSAAPFETTIAPSVGSSLPPLPTSLDDLEEAGAGGSGGGGKFSLLKPSWSCTLDVQSIASGAVQPFSDAIRLLPVTTGSATAAASSFRARLQIDPHELLRQQLAAAAAGEGGSGSAAAPATAAAAGTTSVTGALLLEVVSLPGAAAAAAAGGGGASSGGPGARRVSRACFRCGLRVVVQKEKGVVVVTNADTGVPVAGAYVKSYVKYGSSDSASFQKDGYTDRRGLMDYWTLTTKPVAKVRSVALLVSHPELGSTVLHTDPPLQ